MRGRELCAGGEMILFVFSEQISIKSDDALWPFKGQVHLKRCGCLFIRMHRIEIRQSSSLLLPTKNNTGIGLIRLATDDGRVGSGRVESGFSWSKRDIERHLRTWPVE